MKEPRPDQLKRFMNWGEFDDAINILVYKIQQSKVKFDGIFGIPRGGLVVAVTLSNRLNIPLIPSGMTLIVDDISSSGETLEKYIGNGEVKTATLFCKPNSKVKPDFYYKDISEKLWVCFPWEVK